MISKFLDFFPKLSRESLSFPLTPCIVLVIFLKAIGMTFYNRFYRAHIATFDTDKRRFPIGTFLSYSNTNMHVYLHYIYTYISIDQQLQPN